MAERVLLAAGVGVGVAAAVAFRHASSQAEKRAVEERLEKEELEMLEKQRRWEERNSTTSERDQQAQSKLLSIALRARMKAWEDFLDSTRKVLEEKSACKHMFRRQVHSFPYPCTCFSSHPRKCPSILLPPPYPPRHCPPAPNPYTPLQHLPLLLFQRQAAPRVGGKQPVAGAAGAPVSHI